MLLDAVEAAAAFRTRSARVGRCRSQADGRRAGAVGELGRGGVVGGRTALCLEHARSAGDVVRQYREAGECHSRHRRMPCCNCASWSAPRYEQVVDAVRAHLHANGFPMVEVERGRRVLALRAPISTVPGSTGRRNRSARPQARRRRCCRISAARCPTTYFPKCLGLPTIWVPHSYPGCSQHAPDEHILLPVTEEALGIMAGLFWDLGRDAQDLTTDLEPNADEAV